MNKVSAESIELRIINMQRQLDKNSTTLEWVEIAQGLYKEEEKGWGVTIFEEYI